MVLRVEAYLRIACSVLGFDIGELWCARKISGYAPTLRFIQLYSSPTYEDFHSTLVHPEGSDTSTSDDSKHRFSPIICRGVCDGGQIVWANTRISNGFIGCTDLPLNTAVGLPVCSVGDDLCILVLYSVPVMHISPNAVEFLCSITRAASEGEGGFLPNTAANPVSPAMTEQFVGVWDMAVFISKYAKDVDFQLLPLNQLQGYIDFQERVAFKELFEDFKQSRDGKFTTKQIQSLRFRGNDELDSLCGSEISYTSDDKDDRIGPGAFTVDFDDSLNDVGAGADADKDEIASVGSSSMLSSTNILKHASSSSSLNWYNSLKSGDEIAQSKTTAKGYAPVDARYSYKKHRERFHEFMVAALGMTIFDAAELWLLSDRTDELNVVAALHRDGDMHILTSQSKEIRLSRGQDVPGKVLVDDHPIWDHNYDNHKDEAEQYPRACAAADIGVRTAFGVPLPGPSGSVGVLMLYSKKEVGTEPLVVTLVLKAAQLLSASALGVGALTKLDIENIIHTPKSTLSDWLHQNQSVDSGNRVSFPLPSLAGIQQKFSSESFTLSPTTSFYQNNETSNDASKSYGAGMLSSGSSIDRSSDKYTLSPVPVPALTHCNPMMSSARHTLSNDRDHDDVMDEAIALQQLKYIGMNMNMNQGAPEFLSPLPLAQQQAPPVPPPVFKEEAIGGPITEEHIRIYNWMKAQIEAGGGAAAMNAMSSTSSCGMSGNQRLIGASTNNPMEEMIAQNAIQLPSTTHYVSDMLQGTGGGGGITGRPAYLQSINTPSINEYQNFVMSQSTGNYNVLPSGGGMPVHGHGGMSGHGHGGMSAHGHGGMSGHGHGGMQQYMNQQGMPVLIGSTKRISTSIEENYAKTGDVRWYKASLQSSGGGGMDGGMLNEEQLSRGGRGMPGRGGMFGSGAGDGSYAYDMQSSHGGGYYGNDFTPAYVEVDVSAAENARHAKLRQQSNALPPVNSFGRVPPVLSGNPAPEDTSGYFYEGRDAQGHNPDLDYCHEVDEKPKVCKLEGCSNLSSKRSPYCSNHTGTRRCQWEGCGKCAQGSTKYCISHGGGRRCTFQGCSKGARDKFFCAAHGGGKRCRVGDCTKSAVGGSKLCTAHGGGKRCQSFGCSKSAQSSTPFCVRHGGGRKCHIGGCSKVARGKTDFCAAHGGGMKCRAESCVKAAAGRYFYCKEHLKIFGGAEEDFDDIEDDELYSGADHGGGGDGGTSDAESSLGKRPHSEDDETVASKRMGTQI